MDPEYRDLIAGCDRLGMESYSVPQARAAGCPWDRSHTPRRNRATLAETAAGSVGFTSCRPLDEGIGAEYATDTHVLTFPARGAFVLHVGRSQHVADVNSIVLHNRGERFQTSHPADTLGPGLCGDDCLWIAPSQETLASCLRNHGLEDAGWSARAFGVPVVSSSTRTFLAQRRLLAHVMSPGGGDALVGQDLITALIDSAAADIAAARPARRGAPLRRDDTTVAHRECTESVKRLLAVRFKEPLVLAEISQRVHVSAFHLCRVFKEQTGMPIHRYLNSLRLREAFDRVWRGTPSLATLARELGFSSHSHFTEAFRKEFGYAPSAVRSGTAPMNSAVR